MKILGIDPGIGRAGWGVIEVQNSKLKVQSYGCIETSKDESTEKRLRTIYEELTAIIKSEKPDVVAVENLFFSTNSKTAMIVGEARGVILLAASMLNLSIATYTPLQVKITVAGYGHAEKKQVEKMTMLQLKMTKKPKLDDTTDALAIALTHAFSYKLKQVKLESR